MFMYITVKRHFLLGREKEREDIPSPEHLKMYYQIIVQYNWLNLRSNMIVTDLLPDFPSVVFGWDDSVILAVLVDCCFLFSSFRTSFLFLSFHVFILCPFVFLPYFIFVHLREGNLDRTLSKS